jgi:hypothetical protein
LANICSFDRLTNEHPFWLTDEQAFGSTFRTRAQERRTMAAITIDSPRWRDGWGESIGLGLGTPPAGRRPELRVVAGGTGVRRPDDAVFRQRRLAVALVALVVTALAVLGATSLLARPASAGTPAAAEASVRVTHVVEAGDTYWSIAAELPHRGDLRTFVDRLVDANGGRALVAGDVLEVPAP